MWKARGSLARCLYGAAERGGCGQRVPSSLSHGDHPGIRDKNVVAPVNWHVSNYVIFSAKTCFHS